MNIPEHWQTAELQELGEWQTGSTPRRSNEEYWGGDILWVSPKDMKTDRIVDTEDHMTEKALEETNSKIIPPGSLIMVTRSGILEHSFPVAINEKPATINQDLKALIPSSKINEEYVYYCLKSNETDILKNCSKDGTTVASINSDSLYAYEISIAPPTEQERIIAKIEELISKLDSGEGELQDAKLQLEKYRRTVLKAAITGKLSEPWRREEQSQSNTITDLNKELFDGIEILEVDSDYPETWNLTTLDQVSDVETGATPLRSNSEFWGGDIPWVKSGAVNEEEINSADEFITEEAMDETTVTLFPPETLIVAMYGQGLTRGKISTLKIEATTNQACAGIIIPDNLSFLRPWVKMYFKDHYHELRRKAAGGVQPNLNLGILRSMEIPLPPKNEIEYICGIVERQMSIIEDTNRSVSENMKRVTHLRQSILKHAFEGKLIPQDPTDDSTIENLSSGDTKPTQGEQKTLSEVTSDVE